MILRTTSGFWTLPAMVWIRHSAMRSIFIFFPRTGLENSPIIYPPGKRLLVWIISLVGHYKGHTAPFPQCHHAIVVLGFGSIKTNEYEKLHMIGRNSSIVV